MANQPETVPDYHPPVNTGAMNDPRSEAVAEACRDVLDDEDVEMLAATEYQYVVGEAMQLLIENDIDDPEAFLKEKGILE
jgi:hypothetical protein